LIRVNPWLRFEDDMSLQELLDALPSYARDLRLNLPGLITQTDLTPQQAWGTLVACAFASRNADLLRATVAGAAPHLSPEAIEAAKTAAALMGMNNIFYRFQHLIEKEKYSTMPARLRMQGLRSHGISQEDFELWCTAVSAVNGCGKCLVAHEHVVLEKGITEEAVLAAVRIASVVHGIAVVLDAETALKPAPVAA
jgi:alkyl hydroperoxide reductase subunit D